MRYPREKVHALRFQANLLHFIADGIAHPPFSWSRFAELGHVATVDILVFSADVVGVVTKNLDAGSPDRRAKREQHPS